MIRRLRVRIPAGAAGDFFSSPDLIFCADSLLGVCSIRVLPQWHVKDPGHSAKSAGGRLHLNTHTPLAQRSRSGLTIPLSRHSVGTYPETSPHATCQGTFGYSRLSSLSHCGLILAYMSGMKKCARVNLHFTKSTQKRSSIFSKSSQARKPPSLPYLSFVWHSKGIIIQKAQVSGFVAGNVFCLHIDWSRKVYKKDLFF